VTKIVGLKDFDHHKKRSIFQYLLPERLLTREKVVFVYLPFEVG